MADKVFTTRIQLRNDTAENWIAKDPILKKGEVGIEIDSANHISKMKVGDGVSKWSELHYAGADAATLEIDSSQVKMSKNFTFTKPIGTVTQEKINGGKGSYTDNAKGQSFDEWFSTLAAEAQNPTVTQPTAVLSATLTPADKDTSVAITSPVEVGTTVTVKYNFVTNPGEYEFGPDTGVNFENYSVTFNNETLTEKSGNFTPIQVTDTTNLSISGTCRSTIGTVPKNNLGEDVDSLRITGDKTHSSTAGPLKGYRGWFYGYYNGDTAIADPTAITSSQIRAFGVKAGFPSSLTTNKMKQMFFAAPQGKKATLKISNAVNGAPLTVQQTTVNVEGYNGYDAIVYDVFYVSNAVAESGESKWTIQ